MEGYVSPSNRNIHNLFIFALGIVWSNHPCKNWILSSSNPYLAKFDLTDAKPFVTPVVTEKINEVSIIYLSLLERCGFYTRHSKKNHVKIFSLTIITTSMVKVDQNTEIYTFQFWTYVGGFEGGWLAPLSKVVTVMGGRE